MFLGLSRVWNLLHYEDFCIPFYPFPCMCSDGSSEDGKHPTLLDLKLAK